jgi:mRNA-degrading endonuclease RelE of RelBE toxin-antitoxin system
MKYAVVITETAEQQFHRLNARCKSTILRAMRAHLRDQPTLESKSRIKRLKGLRQPQYRLRVDDFRVFYDVNEGLARVEVLGLVTKQESEMWLKSHGVPQ